MILKSIRRLFVKDPLEDRVRYGTGLDSGIRENRVKAHNLAEDFLPLIKSLENQVTGMRQYCELNKSDAVKYGEGLIMMGRIEDKLCKARQDYYTEIGNLRKSNLSLEAKFERFKGDKEAYDIFTRKKEEKALEQGFLAVKDAFVKGELSQEMFLKAANNYIEKAGKAKKDLGELYGEVTKEPLKIASKEYKEGEDKKLNKKFHSSYKDDGKLVKIYTINGEKVRDGGFIDWVDGGHHYVDDNYAGNIPEGEIWIDDILLDKPQDLEAIIVHEKVERYLMKHLGYIYEKAHKLANKLELQFRKEENEGVEKSEDPQQKKIAKVMAEFKAGKLKSLDGKVVTSEKQALAIAYSYFKGEDGDIKKSLDIVNEAYKAGQISKDILLKAYNNYIQKATYTDNAENRRLKRVGKQYGGDGQEEEAEVDEKDEKEETDNKEQKTQALESHAEGASTGALERAAEESEDPDVQEAAKKELDKRGEGGDNEGTEEESTVITEKEIKAINSYTKEDYRKINRGLLKGKGKVPDDLKEQVDTINKALDKLPSVKGEMFRGMSIPDNIDEMLSSWSKGGTIIMDSFTSTSQSKDVAKKFGDFQIKISGKSGKDISSMSDLKGEKEILFKTGAKFKVKSIKVKKMKTPFLGDRVVSVDAVLEEI